MSDHDAFEEEMLFRTLSDRDVERLLHGQGPEEGGRLVEVAEFAQALRETLPVAPPRDEAIVRRLAAAARTARLEAELGATTRVTRARFRDRRGRRLPPRLAMLARATAVLAAVPMLFAALALADVTLPKPARDAFEALGVDLPNQPADDQGAAETSGGAAGEKSRESHGAGPAAGAPNSERARGRADHRVRGHGTAKDNPARAGGRANGEQGQGRALGKRGLAPGQIEPPGQSHAPGQLNPKRGKANGNDAAASALGGAKSGAAPGKAGKAKPPSGTAESPAGKGRTVR